jgi:hypothetical protein
MSVRHEGANIRPGYLNDCNLGAKPDVVQDPLPFEMEQSPDNTTPTLETDTPRSTTTDRHLAGSALTSFTLAEKVHRMSLELEGS